ncbi:MAG: phosphoribosyltransferase family protein [Bacteroidia bacterium]|nr:phosphoribosyltransferase family protein [Bacteroidia bacterium]MDW8332768.1 phosphoribosyltransferase family protein [Bacteroidia bacterium]
MSRLILTPAQAEAKLRRMACKILEDHYDLERVALVAVGNHGLSIGRRLLSYAEGFCPGKLTLETDLSQIRIAHRCLVLADGVLFTGETMRRALARMNDFEPLCVKIAVLIDRGHARWPLRADYVGLHLATTLHQYVRIENDGENYRVFLD